MGDDTRLVYKQRTTANYFLAQWASVPTQLNVGELAEQSYLLKIASAYKFALMLNFN
jgi:hypothetical protein